MSDLVLNDLAQKQTREQGPIDQDHPLRWFKPLPTRACAMRYCSVIAEGTNVEKFFNSRMLKVHSTKIASNERCFYIPDGIVKFEGFLMGCFSDCISTKFSTYARNGVLRNHFYSNNRHFQRLHRRFRICISPMNINSNKDSSVCFLESFLGFLLRGRTKTGNNIDYRKSIISVGIFHLLTDKLIYFRVLTNFLPVIS